MPGTRGGVGGVGGVGALYSHHQPRLPPQTQQRGHSWELNRPFSHRRSFSTDAPHPHASVHQLPPHMLQEHVDPQAVFPEPPRSEGPQNQAGLFPPPSCPKSCLFLSLFIHEMRCSSGPRRQSPHMVKGSWTLGCVRGWAAYSNPGLSFPHLQDELLTVPTFH